MMKKKENLLQYFKNTIVTNNLLTDDLLKRMNLQRDETLLSFD